MAEPLVDTALNKIKEFINGKELDTAGNNFKKEGIAEESLSKALQEKLTTKLGLKLEKKNESLEGVTEIFYQMEKAASTLTLPAATLNRMIGVLGAAEGSTIKVTASAGKIFGDFLASTGETTITLTYLQHVILIANGTNWVIIAGEPKREQTYVNKSWTKAEAEAGVTPSATRPALVAFTAFTLLTIGGVEVHASAGPWMVLPGQTWKMTVATETSTLLL